MTDTRQSRFCLTARILSAFLIIAFCSTTILPPGFAQQIGLTLPVPGTMVNPSPVFTPVLLKGMTVHPENPLRFDFIVEGGDSQLHGTALKHESQRLVNYFLASMTVPRDDLWVNLSPTEHDRIIPDELAKTELGRDLLAQDYILKQLAASLMHPDQEPGRQLWERIHTIAREQYGVTDIPTDTFNKVWIMPESASVYEYNNTVYITDTHLKVMLDSDYQRAQAPQDPGALENSETEERVKQIIREVILPQIESEVNHGKNFAPVRQIYHSLILAKWYKETVHNSVMSQVYIDQNKTAGIETGDPGMKQRIYERYMEAYKKGAFNIIKEEYDDLSQTVIPRQYFSGGFTDSKNFSFHQTTTQLNIKNSKSPYTTSVAIKPLPNQDQATILEPVKKEPDLKKNPKSQDLRSEAVSNPISHSRLKKIIKRSFAGTGILFGAFIALDRLVYLGINTDLHLAFYLAEELFIEYRPNLPFGVALVLTTAWVGITHIAGIMQPYLIPIILGTAVIVGGIIRWKNFNADTPLGSEHHSQTSSPNNPPSNDAAMLDSRETKPSKVLMNQRLDAIVSETETNDSIPPDWNDRLSTTLGAVSGVFSSPINLKSLFGTPKSFTKMNSTALYSIAPLSFGPLLGAGEVLREAFISNTLLAIKTLSEIAPGISASLITSLSTSYGILAGTAALILAYPAPAAVLTAVMGALILRTVKNPFSLKTARKFLSQNTDVTKDHQRRVLRAIKIIAEKGDFQDTLKLQYISDNYSDSVVKKQAKSAIGLITKRFEMAPTTSPKIKFIFNPDFQQPITLQDDLADADQIKYSAITGSASFVPTSFGVLTDLLSIITANHFEKHFFNLEIITLLKRAHRNHNESVSIPCLIDYNGSMSNLERIETIASTVTKFFERNPSTSLNKVRVIAIKTDDMVTQEKEARLILDKLIREEQQKIKLLEPSMDILNALEIIRENMALRNIMKKKAKKSDVRRLADLFLLNSNEQISVAARDILLKYGQVKTKFFIKYLKELAINPAEPFGFNKAFEKLEKSNMPDVLVAARHSRNYYLNIAAAESGDLAEYKVVNIADPADIPRLTTSKVSDHPSASTNQHQQTVASTTNIATDSAMLGDMAKLSVQAFGIFAGTTAALIATAYAGLQNAPQAFLDNIQWMVDALPYSPIFAKISAAIAMTAIQALLAHPGYFLVAGFCVLGLIALLRPYDLSEARDYITSGDSTTTELRKALKAISQKGSRKEIPLIMPLLSHQDPEIIHQTEITLQALEATDKELITAYLAVLESANKPAVSNAVDFLKKQQLSQKEIDHIQGLLSQETEPWKDSLLQLLLKTNNPDAATVQTAAGKTQPVRVDEADITVPPRRLSLNKQSELQPGGIDMNEIGIDRRGEDGFIESGEGIMFEMQGMEDLLNMDIQGFTPVIIDMTPLNSVLPLLGLAPIEKGIKFGQEEIEQEFELSRI